MKMKTSRSKRSKKHSKKKNSRKSRRRDSTTSSSETYTDSSDTSGLEEADFSSSSSSCACKACKRQKSKRELKREGYSTKCGKIENKRYKKKASLPKKSCSWKSKSVSDDSFSSELVAEGDAAISIQRVYRGYKIRRNPDRFVRLSSNRADFFRHLNNNYAEELFVELIDDVLLGDLIPNILIDLLTNRYDEYDPFDPEEQTAFEICYTLLSTVIKAEADKVVRSCLREFVDNYLEYYSSRKQEHPLQSYVNHLLDEFCKSFLYMVVKEAIGELVNDYLFASSFEQYMISNIEPMIRQAAVDAMCEVEIEDQQNLIITHTLDSLCKIAVEESVKETEDVISTNRQNEIKSKINRLSSRIIDSIVLDLLLKTVANRGENLALRAGLNNLFNVALIETMYQKIQAQDALNASIKTNRPLLEYFNLITRKAISENMLKAIAIELEKEEEALDNFERHTDRDER